MNKLVLITGATAGIGEACAKTFAANGWNLIITGRRANRLQALSDQLRAEFGVRCKTLAFDVSDRKAAMEVLNSLSEEDRKIDVLLNNAGLALGSEPFQDASLDDMEIMIDTNVKGLLYVTRVVAPWMQQRGQGHIINLGSIAGHGVYPTGHVYCATKHAVVALSKAMRLDMVKDNIKVSTISPGAVKTDFSMVRYKGDQDKFDEKYQGYEALSAKDIADSTYFVASQPAHVNIEEIVIQPVNQASHFMIHREV